jgi:uncharacterized membrane protein YidH (DUF202 family)
MAPPAPTTDRGLARERTVLAWNRSGLAAVVCIAVLLRHVWPLHGDSLDLAVGLIAAAAILWAAVLVAVTTWGADREASALLGPRLFGLMTTGTMLLAAVAFVLAFVAAP